MDVFTPAQARSAGEERIAKDALRARTIADTTRELLRTKEEVEREFEETMSSQREEAEQWYADMTLRKGELEKEVNELLKKREEALSPLLIKEGDIHSVGEALKARELSVKAREERTEEESRLLMRRLDELSTREQDSERKEKQLKSAELGIESQKRQVAESARLLNGQIAEFQTRSNDKEFEFSQRQSELDATANLYREKESLLSGRERELEVAKRLLSEERETNEASALARESKLKGEEARLKELSVSFALREIELKEKEKHIKSLEVKIEKEKEKILLRSGQYESEYSAFQERVAETERNLLFLRSEIEATQNLQQEKEQGFIQREQDIETSKIQLADQRVLLDKGFSELRKLKKQP